MQVLFKPLFTFAYISLAKVNIMVRSTVRKETHYKFTWQRMTIQEGMRL